MCVFCCAYTCIHYMDVNEYFTHTLFMHIVQVNEVVFLRVHVSLFYAMQFPI